MKFSTKTTYGLRAMACIMKYQEAVPISRIAKEEDISQKYLEKIIGKLKKNGLLMAEKGATGGYFLAKDPQNITVYDIVKALDGGFNPFHCVEKNKKIYCHGSCACSANNVLLKVQKMSAQALERIKLSDF